MRDKIEQKLPKELSSTQATELVNDMILEH